ncbi:MAG: menaquinone biosynthesis protein [Bacteroidetes bacterium]|nr:menaquinone biosynthesis protein [Bacteroidota bacterium]
MDQKIRIGAVSYLNTKPLLYGIERAPIRKDIQLIIDYPASIAAMLLKDEIDMGLVPVAIIPFLKESYINGQYCIGSDGDVASVCIFSETPIEKVEKVLLDYQSRTSVRLARILLKEYWKSGAQLVDAGKDFREDIKGTTAGVVIGDRALEQRRISPYIYDLAGSWKAFTGLPFVFAAWISNKPIDPNFIAAFDEANAQGIAHIEEVLAENPYSIFPLRDYYTKHLNYQLDSLKRKGLERFLQYLASPVVHPA